MVKKLTLNVLFSCSYSKWMTMKAFKQLAENNYQTSTQLSLKQTI